jgi:opine dehydrogenase
MAVDEPLSGALVAMRIGIIGAGHAGITLLAHIKTALEDDVLIYAFPDHSSKLKGILENGGTVRFEHRPLGTVAIATIQKANVAASIRELVEASDVIYNTTPINAHDDIFDEVYTAAIETGHSPVYINVGGGFAVFSHILRQGKRDVINVGTMHTLPYACRVSDGNAALLNVRKSTLAAFSKTGDGDLQRWLSPLFGANIELDNSVLHASLDRSSYVMHPLMTLFNLNKIEREEKFYFYADGFSKSITKLLRAAGEERIELARKLGYEDYPDPERRLNNFHASYSEDFKTVLPPGSLDHRYITEDIPFGLVPICGLGRAIGVDMPVCRSLVDMASAMSGVDFWDTPYNLAENPGLISVMLRNA